jgi:hypothetical protein
LLTPRSQYASYGLFPHAASNGGVLLAELFCEFGGDTAESLSDIGGYKWIIFFFGDCITRHFNCYIAPLLFIIIGAKSLFHDVEVLMGCNCGWGIVFFPPVSSDDPTQHLAGDSEKMFFIFDFVDAYPQDGFLYEVFGLHAVFDLCAGCLHEHATELSEGFRVVNHLSCGLYDGCECACGCAQLFMGVFGICVSSGFLSSSSQWFGGNVAEIHLDGQPSGNFVWLDVPEGGQNAHAVVEVRARYHIRAKVRSF